MVQASAPGKLFIAGEYAVLRGGTALVAAVDVRAHARVESIAGTRSLFIHPQTNSKHPFLVTSHGTISWADDAPEPWSTLPESLLVTLAEHAVLPKSFPALSLSVDTRDFFVMVDGQPRKLGLGSSAAASVALTAACVDALGGNVEWDSLCRAVHERLQGTAGSGADVLAALRGGIIAMDGESNRVQRLEWPRGLHVTPVWTGVDADSSILIRRFDEFLRGTGADRSRTLNDMKAAASAALAAWRSGRIDDLLEALGACDDTLQRLDRAAGIGIDTGAHRELRRVAATAGGVYKISGAGGGDLGLAFCDSRHVSDAIATAFRAAGFRVPDIHLGAAGMRIDARQ